MERGFYTRNEILTQTDAWQDALKSVGEQKNDLKQVMHDDVDQVVFTGCGSTYYLSLAAAALFQQLTGKPARAIPGGEMLLYPGCGLVDGKTLLVAVSRSGSTTETVKAVEEFRSQNRGPVVAVTNYGDQPLAGLADVPVIIEKGQEQSVAQTRSFASMYVATTALTALLAGREDLRAEMPALAECGVTLMENYDLLAKEIGENLAYDRYYFLGSGPRYGLACEVNLKMKEMTLTHSEPFHFLEFRHGPMSMVSKSAVVLGLLSDVNRRYEQKVLMEMEVLGGHVIGLGESGVNVNFTSGISEAVRNVLYLPVLQLMGYYRSLAKGLNPDNPNNLTAVVKLDFNEYSSKE